MTKAGKDFNSGLKARARRLRRDRSLRRDAPVHPGARGRQRLQRGRGRRAAPRRLHGESKFGRARFWRGFFDLITVKFLTTYRTRPFHILGGLGAACAFVGGGLLTWMFIDMLLGHADGRDLSVRALLNSRPNGGPRRFADLPLTPNGGSFRVAIANAPRVRRAVSRRPGRSHSARRLVLTEPARDGIVMFVTALLVIGVAAGSRPGSSSGRDGWRRSRPRRCSTWRRPTSGSSRTSPTSSRRRSHRRRAPHPRLPAGVLPAQGRLGQWLVGPTPGDVVVGGSETVEYILAWAADTGESYLPEQVHAVIETQLEYLREIGGRSGGR